MTRNLVMQSLIVYLGSSLLYGYHFTALNLPITFIKEFYNATYTERGSPLTSHMSTFLFSLTVTVFLAGCFFGTLLGGAVSKRIGRKKIVLLGQFPSILGSILQTICVSIHSPESLIIGRFLSGFGAGMGLQVVPIHVSEISPQNIRGIMISGNVLITCIGIVLSGICGLDKVFGTKDLWIYILLIPIFPSVLCTFLIFTVEESPRFLLLDKNNQAEAEKALQKLRQRQDVSKEIASFKFEESSPTDKEKSEKYTILRLLKSKEYHLPLFLAFMLPLCLQTTAMAGIFFYTPGIFKNIGLTEGEIQYSVLGMYLCLLVGTFMSINLVDRIGRRPLLLFTLSGITVILLIMWLCSHFQNSASWLSYIGVVCALLFCLCFTMGPGSLVWVIPPELFKQGPRDVATSFSVISIWMTMIIFSVTFEFIVEAIGAFVFLLFMGLTFCITLLFFWKLPETKNKTFQEIADMLSGTKLELTEAELESCSNSSAI